MIGKACCGQLDKRKSHKCKDLSDDEDVENVPPCRNEKQKAGTSKLAGKKRKIVKLLDDDSTEDSDYTDD